MTEYVVYSLLLDRECQHLLQQECGAFDKPGLITHMRTACQQHMLCPESLAHVADVLHGVAMFGNQLG